MGYKVNKNNLWERRPRRNQPGNVVELSRTGRLRWKIENEGFNTQKHLGYGLEHN